VSTLEDAYEEWKRQHPVTHFLRRYDAWTDEIMLAVGTPLLHLLQRLGLTRTPDV